MNQQTTKSLVVKSQKLAGFLMLKGFKLHEIRPDKFEPYRNVFIFTDSEQVHEAIQEYKKQK